MMKATVRTFLSILLVAVMAYLSTSCTKNEFYLEFSLPAAVNEAYTVVYYASDPKKGWIIDGVVAVQSGKAELKCITRNPTLVYILDKHGRVGAVAYAERGDRINISGDNSDPLTWKLSGNKITDALSEWRLSNRQAISDVNSGNPRKVNKAVTDYVSKNEDNPVSTLLLLLYYDRGADEAGFMKTWKLLKGKASDGKWSDLVARADMLEGASIPDDLPGKIVLNTIATGCDTIVPGRVPTLFYFSAAGLPGYREDIKVISRLSREFSDSSKRVIANVSFEADSSARWHSWRGDSLTAAVQGWVPLGLSDVLIRDLGVRKVPSFIIIDRKGKAVYRGDDSRKADEVMRSLLKD